MNSTQFALGSRPCETCPMRMAPHVLSLIMVLGLIGCTDAIGADPTQPPSETAAPTALPTATATVTPSATPTETPPPTPTEIVFTIIKYLSPIKAGHRTQLTIQVKPGDECFLAYTTPVGTLSKAQGLGKRIANADGICGWTWSVRKNTRPGKGKIEVTVNGVTVSMPIIIEAP